MHVSQFLNACVNIVRFKSNMGDNEIVAICYPRHPFNQMQFYITQSKPSPMPIEIWSLDLLETQYMRVKAC